jgi:hypothetical protein
MNLLLTVLEAIQKFLMGCRPDHNGPDLIDRWTPDMETQVNVSSRGYELVEGKGKTYTDGEHKFWNIRIPKDAKTNPYWRDYQLTWPLGKYVEAIGCTGWDWVNRCSRWVGFDFDAIVGHAAGVGVDDAKLNEIVELAKQLPYVEIRKSTGGKGIHIYVLLNAILTANHTEHAALARCVLSLMSSAVGFDFAANVDACGGNMWIWNTKSTPENEGFKLIKAAERPLTESELPGNWRDHIEVVTKKRTKVRVSGIADAEQERFERLIGGQCFVELDDDHRRLMDWLVTNGHTSVWNQDHRILITHTASLKEAHEALKLGGVFETVATGKDQGDHNCYCYPQRGGAWTVYRYSPGAHEAKTWLQSEKHWTYCHFNRPMDLKSAAAAFGAIKAQDGSYSFRSINDVRQALRALGINLDLPENFAEREVVLKTKRKDLLAVTKQRDGDPAEMRNAGWLNDKVKGATVWTRVWELPVVESEGEAEAVDPAKYDQLIRHVVTPTLQDAGWAVLDDKGRWLEESRSNAKSVLKSFGLSESEADAVLGCLVTKEWDLVNQPFQDEFPGDRRWNRDGAKLAYIPSDKDSECVHPHWDMIFDHCGQGLNDAVANDQWCHQNGVRTGRDYLQLWAAMMIQCPTHHLPYLFFYSDEQNTGKSSFHQSLGLLFQKGKGYVEADSSLTNDAGFNRPLAGAVLCYVEETDLGSASAKVYNRIKNWTTGDYLSIQPKGIDPYMLPNTTHWTQCANSRDACPVFEGDKRIVVIEVQPLSCDEIPWQTDMRPALEREAPDFLRTILDLPLPDAVGRLRLPVLETDSKRASMSESKQGDKGDSTPAIDPDWVVAAIRRFVCERHFLHCAAIRADEFGFWEGTPTMLAEALGLSASQAKRLSAVIGNVEQQLRKHGIVVESRRSSSQRILTIGESWLLEGPADDAAWDDPAFDLDEAVV